MSKCCCFFCLGLCPSVFSPVGLCQGGVFSSGVMSVYRNNNNTPKKTSTEGVISSLVILSSLFYTADVFMGQLIYFTRKQTKQSLNWFIDNFYFHYIIVDTSIYMQ